VAETLNDWLGDAHKQLDLLASAQWSSRAEFEVLWMYDALISTIVGVMRRSK